MTGFTQSKEPKEHLSSVEFHGMCIILSLFGEIGICHTAGEHTVIVGMNPTKAECEFGVVEIIPNAESSLGYEYRVNLYEELPQVIASETIYKIVGCNY